MSRDELVMSMIREVGEYFSEYRYSKTLRLPMWDDRGNVVATANSLRSLGYKVTIRQLMFGNELVIIKP